MAFSLNQSFSPVLRRQIERFNDPSSDKITTMKNDLSDIKGVMVNNIEKVLERGERIELLVDKTDRLNQSSFKFEKTSRQLKDVSMSAMIST
jgi:vesicle-associated membrane protein 7